MNKKNDPITIEEMYPILDSIADAIFIDSKDGISLWCNKACRDLYRVKAEDIIGMHVLDLEKNGIFAPSVANMVIQKQEDVTIVHKNKEGKELLSTGHPIFDKDGNLSKIVTTSRDISELSNLQNELETVQTELDSVQTTLDEFKSIESFTSKGFVAQSKAMFNVLILVKRLATVDSTVLITGESGVGKGVIARLLHDNGNRKAGPFISVNCGAIPETLIESELFGYVSGAFTGSKSEGKKGLFQAAQGGTIFLDEISELPLNLQVKLLQVIQDREITPVGGTKSIPINVRIISASNKDLRAQVAAGRFREDLFYRLNVVPISVPPLRERTGDIMPLINKLLADFNKRLSENKKIDSTAAAVLVKYNWPGNVRELQNIIERLIITTKENTIRVESIPKYIVNAANQEQPASQGFAADNMQLKDAVEGFEKSFLKDTAMKYRSTREMARALNVSQPTIVRKLNRYGIIMGETR